MTNEQAINYIKEYCFTEDIESNHSEADKALTLLLCSMGCSDVVDEWRKVKKWYA